MKKARKVRSLTFLQGTALNLLKHSILFILLWLIFRKVLTTGELIAMQFISSAIFGPLQDLGNIILQIPGGGRLHPQLRHAHAKSPSSAGPKIPIEIGPLEMIRFENVVFRHRTASFNAVDGISFNVRGGETIAIRRPFGIGEVHPGEVARRALHARSAGPFFSTTGSSTNIRYNPLRRQIGFVTQETQLYRRQHQGKHAVRQGGRRRRGDPGCLGQGPGDASFSPAPPLGSTRSSVRTASSSPAAKSSAFPSPGRCCAAAVADLRRGHFGARLA